MIPNITVQSNTLKEANGMGLTTSIEGVRFRLTISAFLLLFVELALIRWLGANIVYLAYFSNFVLIGSFLGIGLGFLWASRSEKSLFPLAPFFLSGFIIFVRLFDVNIEVGGSDLIFFADQRPVGPPRWFILTVVFCVVAACVACLADGVARSFSKLKPLDAYRWDLVGSIAGVAFFSVLSFAGLPPIFWGVIAGVILLALVHDGNLKKFFLQLVAVALFVVFLAVESMGPNKAWSPYYALSWEDQPSGGVVMKINDVATWGQADIDDESPYGFIYDMHTKESPGEVLIIGAGSGNDVAVALDRGAVSVDAVEIDPKLLEIAEKYHPNDPYSDPRVETHVDDGRAFLESSSKKWDMILLALPDSLTVVLGQGSVRLESYLFTKEAVESYREHLKPDGVFAMYNFMRESWLVDRYAATLDEEFAHSPCVIDAEARFLSVLVATDTPSSLDCPNDSSWFASLDTPSPVSDDQPFPYLRDAHIPGFYLLTTLLILLVSAFSVRAAAGSLSGFRRHYDVFFMGLAFLLLETKNVVQFALLFGTTWFVNALVFISVLFSVLFAVELSQRVKLPKPKILYCFLALSLAVNWIIPAESLLSLSPVMRLFFAGILAFLPIFIANLIFAERFRGEKDSTVAFGANILGAVLGGLLEYTALLVGYRSLLFIVAAAYALAFVSDVRRKSHDELKP